jgi:hypothetical protein
MNDKIRNALISFANTTLWDTIRDEVIEELAREYRDVSRPFRYGDEQLTGVDAFYAKVGASEALSTLIKIINRLKKSKGSKPIDFE